MLGDAPLSKYTGVPGWQTNNEEETLIQLARQYVPETGGVIVELGVEYARSTAQFAYAVKDKQDTRIVSVDLFPDDHHLAKQHGGLFNVWESNLRESGLLNNPYNIVVPMRGISWEIGENWSAPIDLLFIDAGHTFEDVTKDIRAWVNHVKDGCVVIFHDVWKDENSHPIHKEVLRAIDEFFGTTTKEWDRHNAPDSLLYFVRKVETQKAVASSASADQPAKKTAKTTRKPRAKKKA